jgi:hypothetical protein
MVAVRTNSFRPEFDPINIASYNIEFAAELFSCKKWIPLSVSIDIATRFEKSRPILRPLCPQQLPVASEIFLPDFNTCTRKNWVRIPVGNHWIRYRKPLLRFVCSKDNSMISFEQCFSFEQWYSLKMRNKCHQRQRSNTNLVASILQ